MQDPHLSAPLRKLLDYTPHEGRVITSVPLGPNTLLGTAQFVYWLDGNLSDSACTAGVNVLYHLPLLWTAPCNSIKNDSRIYLLLKDLLHHPIQTAPETEQNDLCSPEMLWVNAVRRLRPNKFPHLNLKNHTQVFKGTRRKKKKSDVFKYHY